MVCIMTGSLTSSDDNNDDIKDSNSNHHISIHQCQTSTSMDFELEHKQTSFRNFTTMHFIPLYINL